MTEHDPIRNDARRTKRQEKLGPDARCVLCGEANWETLTPVRRSLLEAHHVVGRANDSGLTVPLCLNCHRKQTERLRQNGTSMATPDTVLARIVAILRGLAAFFIAVGETLSKLADDAVRLLRGLDENSPQWRQMAEAT